LHVPHRPRDARRSGGKERKPHREDERPGLSRLRARRRRAPRREKGVRFLGGAGARLQQASQGRRETSVLTAARGGGCWSRRTMKRLAVFSALLIIAACVPPSR